MHGEVTRDAPGVRPHRKTTPGVPRRMITPAVMVRAASELRSALVGPRAAATLQPPPNLCALLAELASCGGEVAFVTRPPTMLPVRPAERAVP